MSKSTKDKVSKADVLNELSYRVRMRVKDYVQEGACYFSVCPKCKSAIERDYQAYCDRCGQALSWRG